MSNAAIAEPISLEKGDVVELSPAANVEPEKRVVKAASPMAQKIMNGLDVLGLGFINPFIRLAYGEDPKAQYKELWKILLVPLLSIFIFLALWHVLAPNVKTSLGSIPQPGVVFSQFGDLWADHKATQVEKAAFYQEVASLNEELKAKGEDPIKFTGKVTFIEQIFLSIRTVFLGFFIATVVAVPIGIMCGMSSTFNAAMNPLIQIFKPVSPLAWLPIVALIASGTYNGLNEPGGDFFGITGEWLTSKGFSAAMVTSALVVTLCSLWATLLNTAHGVSSIDKDLMNVSKVLKLSPVERITKIVLPSSLPLIFTGLRLSLGVGWMVLIAAEIMSQSPGLGQFVWEEYNNNGPTSLARIIAAVLVIGVIGFLLDRMMYTLQATFTFSDKR